MTTAYEALLAKIHGIITARDLDVTADPTAIRRIVETETERFQREATIGAERFPPFADPDDVVARLLRDISSVGSELDQWIAHPDVEEIWGIDGELWARMTTGEVVAVPTPASALAVRTPGGAVRGGGRASSSTPRTPGRTGCGCGCPAAAKAGCRRRSRPGWTGRSTSRFGSRKKRHTTFEDLVLSTRLTSVGGPVPGRVDAGSALEGAGGRPARGGQDHDDRGAAAGGVAPPACDRGRGEPGAVRPAVEREVLGHLEGGGLGGPDPLGSGGLPAADRAGRAERPRGVGSGHGRQPGDRGDRRGACRQRLVGVRGVGHVRQLGGAGHVGQRIREKFARIFDVVIFVDMDDSDDDNTLRQITEISVVPPQMSTAGVAVTPIFARADIGEPMELHSTELGRAAERKCNRVLRRHRSPVRRRANRDGGW